MKRDLTTSNKTDGRSENQREEIGGQNSSKSKALNLYQKINEVRKRVAYVQKDTKVAGQYKAVSHDLVVSVIREHLVEKGILVWLSQRRGGLLPREVKKIGDKEEPTGQFFYEGEYDIVFRDVDSDDNLTVSMQSLGADTSDKGPGKAASYAFKYALLKMFFLETGEDEESRAEQRAIISEEQLVQLNDYLENNLDQQARFLRTYGIAEVSELPARKFNEAITILKASESKK